MKEKVARLLRRGAVPVFNRYVKFCKTYDCNFRLNLTSADLSLADLTGSDLTSANLTAANLLSADLSLANLTGADLSRANLTSANLTLANLTRANLFSSSMYRADLYETNLDDSCWPLRCGSLDVKTSKRLRVQMAYHFLAMINNGHDVTDEEIKIFNTLRNYANTFHQIENGVARFDEYNHTTN